MLILVLTSNTSEGLPYTLTYFPPTIPTLLGLDPYQSSRPSPHTDVIFTEGLVDAHFLDAGAPCLTFLLCPTPIFRKLFIELSQVDSCTSP